MSIKRASQSSCQRAFEPLEGRRLLSGTSSALIADVPQLVFGDVVGGGASASRTITLSNTGNTALTIPVGGISISGAASAQFEITAGPASETVLAPGASLGVAVSFGATALGPQGAVLHVMSDADATNPSASIDLRGLGTKGEQGDLEPSFQWILDTYQIAARTGDSSPAEATLDTPAVNPNDEVVAPLFTKAGPGPVSIVPIAVYSGAASPALTLGYYTKTSPTASTMRKTLYTVPSTDVQTMNPRVVGTSSFDPGPATFGLHSTWAAQGNRTVYSEDSRNTFISPVSLQRMFKSYPLTNPDGTLVPNAFVVGNEEAFNHDYQDAVFIIRNVKPAQAFPAANPTAEVTGFTLINAVTGKDIGPLTSGQTIDFAQLGTTKLSVRATVNGTAGSVKWLINASSRIESSAPYSIAGDTGTTYTAWTPPLGANTVTVTPYSGASASGTPGIALTVNFNVVLNSTPPPSSPQAIVVSTNQLVVAEGGVTPFSVKLAVQPTNDIVVSIARSGGDTDLNASASSLTFTAANWNVAQTIQIAAAQDADMLNGSAAFTITSTGLPSKTVNATESDDDFIGPTVLRAVADAYVRDGGYAGTNFGSATQLQLKKAGAGWNRESFLRFDLTSLTSISSAKLRLFGKLDNTTAPSVGFAVYASTNTTWNAATMTWNTRPAATGGVLASATVVGTTGKWYELDLTTLLQQQKAAGAASVTLVLKASATSNATILFDSDEGANRPELVVAG